MPKTSSPEQGIPGAILFDLDGTLVDTAPDLAFAINKVRADRNLPPVPYEQLRQVASAGAPGLIKTAFDINPDNPVYKELADTFIHYYSTHIAENSILFDGIEKLLELLRNRHIPWGVVTNKKHILTVPLLQALQLTDAASIISGDTTPHMKPHPEPVLEAARQMNIAPQNCWFIGDDKRDVIAGKAAGTITIAANWGYGTDTHSWDAHLILDTPYDVCRMLA